MFVDLFKSERLCHLSVGANGRMTLAAVPCAAMDISKSTLLSEDAIAVLILHRRVNLPDGL